jgi:hypothetical protein
MEQTTVRVRVGVGVGVPADARNKPNCRQSLAISNSLSNRGEDGPDVTPPMVLAWRQETKRDVGVGGG